MKAAMNAIATAKRDALISGIYCALMILGLVSVDVPWQVHVVAIFILACAQITMWDNIRLILEVREAVGLIAGGELDPIAVDLVLREFGE